MCISDWRINYASLFLIYYLLEISEMFTYLNLKINCDFSKIRSNAATALNVAGL